MVTWSMEHRGNMVKAAGICASEIRTVQDRCFRWRDVAIKWQKWQHMNETWIQSYIKWGGVKKQYSQQGSGLRLLPLCTDFDFPLLLDFNLPHCFPLLEHPFATSTTWRNSLHHRLMLSLTYAELSMFDRLWAQTIFFWHHFIVFNRWIQDILIGTVEKDFDTKQPVRINVSCNPLYITIMCVCLCVN